MEANPKPKGFLARLGKLFGDLSFARVVVLGFACAIFLGSLGLYFCEGGHLSYIDALYFSGSALCVTGLAPVPLSSLQTQTQVLILLLIQLGGLGIIGVTVIVGFLVRKGISRNARFITFTSAAIDRESSKSDKENILRILIAIVNISVTLESLGAVGLYLHMPDGVEGPDSRWFLSIFTSVSAFNNAGFSILDDVAFLKESSFCLGILSFLVVLGGIGFPVIILMEKILLTLLHKVVTKLEVLAETLMMHWIVTNKINERRESWLEKPAELSAFLMERIENYNEHLFGESNKTQTKLLLYGSILLVFFGFLGVYFQELQNEKTLGALGFGDGLMNAFFISICARTAGFATMDFANLRDSSVVVISMLMFIGGGPQGTAGGIKITTFALLLAYLKNVIQPSKPVQLFGDTISKNSVAIAIRVYFLATIVLAVLFLLLSFINTRDNSLQKILFELLSAFSTVGYSLNLTPELDDIEKLIYTFVMLGGRVGIFTMLIAATGHSGVPKLGNEDDGTKIQVG